MVVEVRQQYMDFMTYLTTEEAKRRLLEEFHAQTVRKQELQARISQMVSCVEQLLNTGVQTLNARLQELEMTDVKCPADILANSKQIVTSHKDITLKVAAMESEVCGLETGLRTAVPYAQLLLEKLETVDLATDDDYDKIILAARAENAATAGEENELPSVQLPDHLLSPSGTPAARRPRARPRASQARRSGGAAAAAAAAAAPAAGASGAHGAAKADNDEVERQIAEIVQKVRRQQALQVDSVAKEKERRAKGAAGAGGVSGGDRKRSGGAGGGQHLPMPAIPVTSAAGAYAAMTAAELLRFQLPSFEHPMDLAAHHQQQQHHH